MFGSDCTNKRFSSESLNGIGTTGQMFKAGQISRDNGRGAASGQNGGMGLKCLTGGPRFGALESWRINTIVCFL